MELFVSITCFSAFAIGAIGCVLFFLFRDCWNNEKVANICLTAVLVSCVVMAQGWFLVWLAPTLELFMHICMWVVGLSAAGAAICYYL